MNEDSYKTNLWSVI